MPQSLAKTWDNQKTVLLTCNYQARVVNRDKKNESVGFSRYRATGVAKFLFVRDPRDQNIRAQVSFERVVHLDSADSNNNNIEEDEKSICRLTWKLYLCSGTQVVKKLAKAVVNVNFTETASLTTYRFSVLLLREIEIEVIVRKNSESFLTAQNFLEMLVIINRRRLFSKYKSAVVIIQFRPVGRKFMLGDNDAEKKDENQNFETWS